MFSFQYMNITSCYRRVPLSVCVLRERTTFMPYVAYYLGALEGSTKSTPR